MANLLHPGQSESLSWWPYQTIHYNLLDLSSGYFPIYDKSFCLCFLHYWKMRVRYPGGCSLVFRWNLPRMTLSPQSARHLYFNICLPSFILTTLHDTYLCLLECAKIEEPTTLITLYSGEGGKAQLCVAHDLNRFIHLVAQHSDHKTQTPSRHSIASLTNSST
jgi:hypothetical protein